MPARESSAASRPSPAPPRPRGLAGARDEVSAAATGGEGGFTLVESIIALTLGSLVVLGAISLFSTQRRATSATEVRSEVHQAGRYALDMLNRDVSRAGEGIDPTSEFAVVATADGGGGAADTTWILRAPQTAPTHETAAVEPGFEKDSLNLRIRCNDPVDDVRAGVLVYIASGSSRGVAYVLDTEEDITDTCSSSDPDTKQVGLLHASVTVIDGEDHGWVFQDNSADMAAIRVVPVVYFAEDPDAAPRRLVRATDYDPDTGDWSGPPVAEGVRDFQVRLQLTDGRVVEEADPADADPDNDYDDIDIVRFDLTLEALRTHQSLEGGQRLTREYSLAVTPRNQMYTRNLK